MTIQKNELQRLGRIRFALFLKILLKLIDSDRLVQDQAKLIVSACIRQHRNGSNKYKNIMDAIELNLRGLVQENTWRSARHYAKVFERKHRNRIQHHAADDCGDQDLLEIEILQPFETNRSNDFEDCYYNDASQIHIPPEPETIGSSPATPNL
ncbi:unnamed protein product [Cylindrotheca closterium]|uniref:Uncharacterized protein n=1 Tax=Cylindrotheca closterium TaxID=2856 RepID=A0AAD2FHM4_9STRA|nr:unnamed protein product [Cylindrotheca closterium]